MSIEKEVSLGSEGKMSIKFEGGKVILTVTHVHASGETSVIAKEDAKYFLELLKAELPSWAQFGVSAIEGALP